jgi:hypothetical protein
MAQFIYMNTLVYVYQDNFLDMRLYQNCKMELNVLDKYYFYTTAIIIISNDTNTIQCYSRKIMYTWKTNLAFTAATCTHYHLLTKVLILYFRISQRRTNNWRMLEIHFACNDDVKIHVTDWGWHIVLRECPHVLRVRKTPPGSRRAVGMEFPGEPLPMRHRTVVINITATTRSWIMF